MNKKIKNKIVFNIIISLIIIASVSIYIISKIIIPNINTNKIISKDVIIPKVENKIKKTKTVINFKKKENFVTLKVFNKIYKIEIKNKNSVYKIMEKLKDTKNSGFSFEYIKYPSLGVFINKINGRKGTSGHYWIYYINNKKASVGVSKYILKSGDTIIWKQENS